MKNEQQSREGKAMTETVSSLANVEVQWQSNSQQKARKDGRKVQLAKLLYHDPVTGEVDSVAISEQAAEFLIKHGMPHCS